MCNRKVLGQLLILFLSTQTTYTKIDEKNSIRIAGGKSVPYGKYPYVVRLEFIIFIGKQQLRGHICTCSVLTPIWTLSASHCSLFSEYVPNATLMIRYGSRLPLEERKKFSKVIKFIRHPSYKKVDSLKQVYSLENDIALLQTESVLLPEYGRVSSVDFLSLVGFAADLFGYGLTNYTSSSNMLFADTLQLNMPLQTINVVMIRCSDDVLEKVKLYPAICLARKCGQIVSICPGDSGGPLIHNSRIIGVNSLAHHGDCSNIDDRLKSGYVGFITAVSPFSEWIGDVINGG